MRGGREHAWKRAALLLAAGVVSCVYSYIYYRKQQREGRR